MAASKGSGVMLQSRFFKLVGIVSVLNVLGMGFAFLREITIGYIYGTSFEADSIITAFTIPNFLYVVIGGSINTAFISTYSKMKESRRRDFVQVVYTILAIISLAITVLFMLFPKFWMGSFFGSMSPEGLQLTSKLFMVTAPATFFLIVSMLFFGLNNIHGNYRYTAFTTLMFNGVYVVIGLVLTPLLGAYSYALGATLGAFTILFLLVYRTKQQDLAPIKPKLMNMPELKKLLYLALPILLGGATMHFYQIIQRIFASGLDEGTIAAVNYTSKISQLPRGVIMASVTTIIYPMLAKAAGNDDFGRIKSAYTQGFRMLTVLLAPASVFLFVYAKDVITAILEYGNFSAESTDLTYPLLQIFTVSVFSLCLNTYITRFYYALETTLLPNIINIISVFGVNILVIVLLIDHIGAAAIAYGTVASAIVNMLLLIYFAKVKLNLVICNWSYLFKLTLYTIISIIVIGAAALLPIHNAFLSLIAGGIVTGLLVIIGLKTLK